MTEQEARRILDIELTKEVVEAIETLQPNRLPHDADFKVKRVAAAIGRQQVVAWLRAIVNERERKALPSK